MPASISTPGPCSCCGDVSNLWFWGMNDNGQNGSGAADSSIYVPTQIGAATNWASGVIGLDSAFGVKSDGTLWFWGHNNYGQNGSGSYDGSIHGPTQVGTATDWLSVFYKTACALAVKLDGTLWFWGQNSYGLDGSGSADGLIYTPTKIGTATNWVSVYGEYFCAFGIRADGKLWFWGRNDGGQDGSGSFDHIVHAPTLIAPTTSWISISYADAGIFEGYTIGLKSGGTLWFWGKNDNGQNGSGAADNVIHAITQIGSIASWVRISSAFGYAIALKSDGTLWFWGMNDYGQNGSGSSDNAIHTPMKIGIDTDWVNIYSAFGYAIALKSDGTLWFWGTNSFGQNGNGSSDGLIYRPMKIGTGTGWVSLSNYYFNVIALSS